MPDALCPLGLQQTRPLCPSPFPKFAQVHVHFTGDAIYPSHPLTPSSPSGLNLSQHQGLFQRVICSHQMNKILEFQLQHQSFQQDSGLIFLEIDWFDLLAVQGAIRSLLQHHSSKVSILQWFWSPRRGNLSLLPPFPLRFAMK